MRRDVFAVASLIAMQMLFIISARAEEVVSLSGGNAVLNAPRSVAASVILAAGGDGHVGIDSAGPHNKLNNPIVFTRGAYSRFGVASLLIDAGVSVPAAIEYMRRFNKPIVLVGMSNGSVKIMGGLGSGPAGIVLWSGRLRDVQSSVGGSSGPPVLVIANPNDECDKTAHEYVEAFKSSLGSRAKIVWVGGGDPDANNPCHNVASPHFMGGHEGQVVSAIVSFAKSVR